MSRAKRRPVEERSYRWAFWVLAALNLAAVAWVVWDETVTRRPWKEHQASFGALMKQRARRAPRPGIKQVTVEALGAADRCQTCHQGIDRPGLTGPGLPRAFRTHPRRATLLGDNHPVARFGCTVCHHGQGLQTKGVAGAAFAHGRRDPSWKRPLLTGPFTESTCVPCHRREVQVPGAPIYNRGRWLFEDRRCHGCHTARFVTFESRAAAPPLGHLRQKMSRAFVTAWLDRPGALRPGTRMPMFWKTPIRPPASDSERSWRDVRNFQVAAIADFLGSIRSAPAALKDAPAHVEAPNLAPEGRRLFDQLGCRGCHTSGGKGDHGAGVRHGPGLARIGERATARWLGAWLTRPRKLWRDARMPDLRLSAGERARLVSYLITLKKIGTRKVEPRWPRATRDRIAAGRAAVFGYGCHGCHEIPGLEAAGRAGPALDDFGDRADRIEWGEGRIDCADPALECWTRTKIERPRSVAGKNIPLMMPDMKLTDRDVRALAVFVLSNRKTAIPRSHRREPAASEQAMHDGELLLARLGCRGCHEIGRLSLPDVNRDGARMADRIIPLGGAIRGRYAEAALAPPPLTGAGAKFQYSWLNGFLMEPTRLRPWLTARMPGFALSSGQRETLIRYFAMEAKQPYPFIHVDRKRVASADREDAIWLFGKLQCYKCHQVSSIAGLKLAELAPDLALSHRRLKPRWIERFVRAPQQVSPGTKMPTYFLLADEDDPTSRITPYPDRLGGSVSRQIKALVRLNMRFGVDPGLEILEQIALSSRKK